MSTFFGINLEEFNEETCSQVPKHSDLETGLTEIEESLSDISRKQKADEVLNSLLFDSNTIKDAKTSVSNASINQNVKEINVPRIKILQIKADTECLHQVAIPPDFDFKPLLLNEKEPAKKFQFKLDSFQQEAIHCIDNSQSVLISAHTSAGKTVVAEYAIASCLLANQRVIYTTPIKALSNQKFREFSEQFPEVGLLTGDATINPNANILIMTTEILQTMLYRGAQVLREVGWVIFDEIHYMRDEERGRVWEEAIILLPSAVRMIFLSATISNARQFAEWIAFLHQQPCHVVSSNFRPVPLRHYLFPEGSEGVYLVLDEGRFMENNFNQAVASIKSSKPGSKDYRNSQSQQGNMLQVIKLVKHRSLEPIIVFSFSKKECEIYALQLVKLDFNTDAEKCVVEEVFTNAIDCLSAEDKSLPQVKSVLPLLKKGIGIHHGGLLPILKETVEILFSEGLIKCLFATETFAMGLNMPARTVLFTSARKFDGNIYRWLTPCEYIQMSGRAGRRGKDDSGTVIFMLADSMTPDEAKDLLQGQSDPLNSAFHLTYNMLLNLMRVEDINPEYLMERSFCQFQNYALLPQMHKDLESKKLELQQINITNIDGLESYCQIKKCLEDLNKEKWKFIHRPQYLVPFLQTGRLVKIVSEARDFGWGIVVNLKKRNRADKLASADAFYLLEVLLWYESSTGTKRIKSTQAKDPCTSSKTISSIELTDDDMDIVVVISDEEEAPEPIMKQSAEILPVKLNCITEISAVRILVPKDLRTSEARENCIKTIDKVKAKMGGKLPDLDPLKDMQISDQKFKEIYKKIEGFQYRLEKHPLHSATNLEDLCQQFEKRDKIIHDIDELQESLRSKVSLIQLNDLGSRKRVLRRLGYCSDLDVIALKGRVACEITSADELLLTELLFDGVFNKLSAEFCAALLSCFVCEERGQCQLNPVTDIELKDALRILQETARRIARISKDCRLDINVEDYVDSFKPAMMSLVADWARGVSFFKLCEGTSIFEGTIVRTLRRLEEILRQMANAAHIIDNSTLEEKFNRAIELIKRDIVFAASLYL